MTIDPSIFKSYDIRAIYPTQLDEEGISQITKAIYKFFTEKISDDRQLNILLSYDMRLSGPKLYAAVKTTLLEMGAHLYDAGMTSTPTFYFAVNHYNYDCGIQVTASHNPPEYNGLKFVINTPKGLLKIGKPTGMDEIKQMALSGVGYTPKFKGTIEEKTGVLEDEVDNALKIFGNPMIKKFKIVADPANAMGGTYIDALFEKIPGELIRMNFKLDGSFPAHQPDPLNFDNLKDLQNKVLSEKADLGLAPDGDGDRLYFIDEKGQVVEATKITSLIAEQMLKQYPGSTILFDIRYILGSQKIVEECGGKSVITKVGHAYITEALTETGGVFAGESSGHFYYKATGNAESQVATIIAVLKVLSEEGKSLSQILAKLQRSYESGEFNFKVSNANEILNKLKDKYKDGQLNDLDGVAITFSNPTWRFNVRSSNTEPLLRLNVESFEKQLTDTKFNELKTFILSIAKQ